MPAVNIIYALQKWKKELWKGIPMSRESEKKYRYYMKLSKGVDTSIIPKGGGPMDESLGGPSLSLRAMRAELEKCAEKDRKSGAKCGLGCQIRKRRL